jgi:NTE family protein
VAGAPGGVAFVLGGGGMLGAHEVGMLHALCERGISPDLILGTSVGALNGAVIAAGFSPDAVTHLGNLWAGIGEDDVFGGSMLAQVRTFLKFRTHLHLNERLRELLETHLPARTFEELQIPFQCVAASIERSQAHWFSSGPLVDAVLASAAVPGLLPAVEIDGEHFYDGGLVHSIPVGRAVSLGADTVYVLQVGRVEEPLTPPETPLQVGLVAFEIARRHRFSEEMEHVPEGVTVHVLPTGAPQQPGELTSQLRYRDVTEVGARIERAYESAAEYLARVES